jgi:DNA gyrase subunit B
LVLLNPGVTIKLVDERLDQSETVRFNHGIREFVTFLNQNKMAVHDDVLSLFADVAADASNPDTRIVVDIAVQYYDSYNEHVYAYANSIFSIERGTHLSGFRTALTCVRNAYAKANNLLREDKDPALTGEDVREGLTAVISTKVLELRFERQTKTRVVNGDADGIVQKILGDKLKDIFETSSVVARKIIDKCQNAARVKLPVRPEKPCTRAR